MDFSLSPENLEYRDAVRRIIAETVTPEVIDRMHTSGTFASPELNRALGGAGFLERAVPGMGKGDPIELWILFHELEKAGAPYDGLAVAIMIAGVVWAVGTDEQKARIIPSITSGRVDGRDGLQRGRLRLRRGVDQDQGRARRRRVGDQRSEDVDHDGPRGRLDHPAHPHRSRAAQAQGPHHVHHAQGHPGHLGRRGAHHGHRAHQRDLLRRRAGRRRRGAGRGERRLAHDDRRPRLRAGCDGWLQRGGAVAAPLPRVGRNQRSDRSARPRASRWPGPSSTSRSHSC